MHSSEVENEERSKNDREALIVSQFHVKRIDESRRERRGRNIQNLSTYKTNLGTLNILNKNLSTKFVLSSIILI